MRTVLRLALLVALLAVVGPAGAEDDGSARGKELARAGLEHYQKREYQAARGLFEQAAALYPSGQVLRMQGYTLMALRRWQQAVDSLDRALAADVGPLPADARGETESNLATARGHLGKVSIRSETAGARVSIDGAEPVSLPLEHAVLEEGTHRLVVEAAGGCLLVRELELGGEEHPELELDPCAGRTAPADEPARPAPRALAAPSRKTSPVAVVGLVGAGAGLTVAGAGIGMLVDARVRAGSVADAATAHRLAYGGACGGRQASDCLHDALVIDREAARGRGLQAAAIGLGAGGAALAGAGLAVFLLGRGEGTVGLTCSPGQGMTIGCTGRF